MGMFNGKININEGKKYDATQVAMEGMSKEEIEAAIKKNNKLIDIYKAYDTDHSGSLNKIELARAMDGFAKTADINGDGKLSKKELEAYAEAFNKQNGLDGENAVRGKDIKAFIKSVRKATKDDTKVQTKDVIAKAEAQERLQAEVDKAINSFVAGMEKQAKAREEAEAARAQAEADAAAQAKAKAADLKQPKSYTVQPNERLDSILKRSLKAQGLEVNEKNMAEAKAEFIKNNPKALHGPKGKEYLYQGDVIKIAGNLEDKGNANEIKAAYQKAQADAKAKAQAEAEAQAKARAEAEAREQARREAGEVPYPAKVNTQSVVPAYEFSSFIKNEDTPEVKVPLAPPAED